MTLATAIYVCGPHATPESCSLLLWVMGMMASPILIIALGLALVSLIPPRPRRRRRR